MDCSSMVDVWLRGAESKQVEPLVGVKQLHHEQPVRRSRGLSKDVMRETRPIASTATKPSSCSLPAVAGFFDTITAHPLQGTCKKGTGGTIGRLFAGFCWPSISFPFGFGEALLQIQNVEIKPSIGRRIAEEFDYSLREPVID